MLKTPRKVTYRQVILGFSRLIRWPNLAIIVFTQYFTRFFLISDKPLSLEHFKEILLEKNLGLISLATVLIAASGYIINDYYDIKIDLVNKPDRVVIGRYIKRRWALLINQIFNGSGIVLGLLVNRRVALVNLAAVFCLWLYANKLKRLAFWGNLMVAILTGFSLLVLAVYYPGHQKEVWVYATFSFFITLIREIIKDMEDVKGDERHGCRTLPIIWGIARTKNLVFAFIAVFISILFTLSVQLNNVRLSYIFLLLMIPVGFLTYKLVYADKPSDFAFLSNACKIIMLLGVLTMMAT
ncbi:geranylgeranylglycerol-phosphate geranylgeranyltransferase [Arcicella rigui]|uniref:Geranylgeranylglycerol-phosphate geranylgeranyltransferase n=1 Tax=Arcicella rigui TaxID=797020 RepID=A0ABU5QDQ1_9BACT|nr:geranylgeranylglycerol-phosphate geranylgeranyltransferase [Arcicella rigui]MEA5140484.1 geranylgeranylglycerol-phosphate geranylgeranyltransferase [Arcicella rigui]